MTVAPVIARVEPIAGESLLSLVARTADANVMPKLAGLLSHAGVGGHPAFAPFTAAGQAEPLAQLLGVPLGEVQSRLHPLHPDQSQPDARVWVGLHMRRRSIAARERRIASLAFKVSVHHRLEWTHRSLSFCPETLQQLISDCPACGAKLGWVTTKGLDRCERCEASLLTAPAPLVPTRSPDRLRAAAGLISPDAAVRASAQAQMSPEFLAWDAGDLFAALCELGFAWRHPGEAHDDVLGRALAAGSHPFEPEDLAAGHRLLEDWPARGGALLDRLASHSNGRRSAGCLTAGHLGVLGRHLRPTASGRSLSGLLRRAVEAEAAARRRLRGEEPEAPRDVPQLAISLRLTEAAKAFAIAPTLLRRLVPDGRSLIAHSTRQGDVRFHPEELAANVAAYRASEGFSDIARRLGAPRYVLPALIEAGLLEACPDPDVPLMMADGAVTARSLATLETTLETRPSGRIGLGVRSLGACLRRRFDPAVWATMLRRTIDDRHVHRLTAPGDERPLLDRVFVIAEFLLGSPPEQDIERLDARLPLKAWEAGRLLGLSAPHLPELVAAGLLKGTHSARGWSYLLGDVVAFHRTWVTGAELRQRHAPSLKNPLLEAYGWREEGEPPHKLMGYAEVVGTRHFTLALRAEVEASLEWPDAALN